MWVEIDNVREDNKHLLISQTTHDHRTFPPLVHSEILQHLSERSHVRLHKCQEKAAHTDTRELDLMQEHSICCRTKGEGSLNILPQPI